MKTRVLLLAPVLAACASPSQTAVTPCTPCQQTAPVAAPSAAQPARSAKLDALGQKRVELLTRALAMTELLHETGRTGLEEVMRARRDVAVAAREGLRDENRRHALVTYHDVMVKEVDAMKERYETGKVNEGDLRRAEAALAEAEYWLAEATEGP